MNILVIDDSKAVHGYVDECFKNTSHTITHAYNGKDAIDKLEIRGSDFFQLILLDWEMPVMNGPEFLDFTIKTNTNVPVIMMTTRNTKEEVTSMLMAGAGEYLVKPFTQDILFEKIEAVLSIKMN